MPFNDFLKRLFGIGGIQMHCKQLNRTTNFLNIYKTWVDEKIYLNWTGPFYKAYHYKKANLPALYRVQLIQETNKEGVILFYDPAIGTANFSFLFEFIKDSVLQQGYRLHSSDQVDIRHESYTENVLKHLLLPPASDMPGSDLCNQLYGNILIDFIKINGQPGYIRFIANSYADSVFSLPRPFDELLQLVLQSDNIEL